MGANRRMQIVSRILKRREVLRRKNLWDNDKSAQLFDERPFDAGQKIYKPLFCFFRKLCACFFFIFKEILMGKPFGNGHHSPCVYNARFAEQLFKILLCVAARYILTRKIQIEIRYLLSVSAEKVLPRNILSLALHFTSADRTDFLRQIKAGFDFTADPKFNMPAIRTAIMGRKRIHLADPGQIGQQGRTGRSTRHYMET